MPELMQAIAGIPGIGPFLPYLVVAVAFAAFVAPLLPAPAESASPAYVVIYKIVNILAQNRGHASNATAPKPNP